MGKKITAALLFVAISLSSNLTAQQPDFGQLDLRVSFEPENGLVEGEVSHRFLVDQPLDSFYLDAIRMEVKMLELNGTEVHYTNADTAIWIYPEALDSGEHLLRLNYRARPRKGLYFIGWDDPTNRAPRQIWTQGQGVDHRHWIPHHDEQTDKVIVGLTVEVDSGFQVMGNGRLTEQTQLADGNIRWRFKMNQPMSSYLIALAIADYDTTLSYSETGIPLTQYYYPQRADDYNYYYYQNQEIFNHLQQLIAVPYPWQNYKQAPVQDFRHGAMENTTATIFGDFFLVDSIAFNDRNYSYVNAHELAHQWFGNLVTASGSDEHWLHEGFATYYQWLSERNLYGEDFFQWERYKAAQLVFQASERDSIPLGNGKAGSARFYQKGAWLLDMLHHDLGDSLFHASMRHYLNRYRFGVVTTDSLREAILEVSSKDYEGFFDRWLHTAGEPSLTLQSELEGRLLKISFSNLELPFAFDLPLRLVYEDGHSEERIISVSPGGEPLEIPLQEELAYWVVNPGMAVLARVREEKPLAVWKRQYRNAEHLLDRYQAVRALSAVDGQNEFLAEVAGDSSEFYSIRALAFEALAANNYPYLTPLMEAALTADDVQLQKAIIPLIDGRKEELGHYLPGLRSGPSYELRESALHLSVDWQNKKANRFLYETLYEVQPGIPGHKLLITALTYRHLIYKDKEALKRLMDFSSPSFDFITRMNAIQALEALQHFDRQTAQHLLSAFLNPNWQLRAQARRVLKAQFERDYGRKSILQAIDARKPGLDDFDKRALNRTFGLNLK